MTGHAKPPSDSLHQRPQRAGYTLLEVVLSTAILSIMIGAMISAILISQRAINDKTSPPVLKAEGRTAADLITADLKLALTISDAQPTSVTFTVPDRTGDDVPETITYAWSGTGGDPVTRTFNGTNATLADNIYAIDFTYLQRTIGASGIANRLLMVVGGDAESLAADDVDRKTQFEEWGYTVTTISDGDSQGGINSALQNADVAYISETVDPGNLETKLKSATIGVVSEESQLSDDFGIASSFRVTTATSMNITDNSHYITSIFPTGSVTVFSTPTSINGYYGTLAGEGNTLAQDYTYSDATLMIMGAGGSLYDGGTAKGRRVMLPWGVTDQSDYGDLTADALMITKRAVAWAAGSN